MIIGLVDNESAGKKLLVDMLLERGFVYCRLYDCKTNGLGIPIMREYFKNFEDKVKRKKGVDYLLNQTVLGRFPDNRYIVDGLKFGDEIFFLKEINNFLMIGSNVISATAENSSLDFFYKMIDKYIPSNGNPEELRKQLTGLLEELKC